METATIVPRKGPDLGLESVPRYWLAGDPFKTRYVDAMAMTFPDGERYFIQCVREWRDQITDPKLAADVKDFIYQEGQHGMVHSQYNDRLRQQGMGVDLILDRIKQRLDYYRRAFSKTYNLGRTAGAEHLTAMMCHGFFHTPMLKQADPRVRAMYAWHSIEEIEHKAVAFDVYQKVAKGGYFTRIASMLHVSVMFPLSTFLIMRHLLRVDGHSTWRVWLKGLWWLYGWGGLWPRLLPHWLAYFAPGFHPWKHGDLEMYRIWIDAYRDSGGDAIAAGDAVAAAVLGAAA